VEGSNISDEKFDRDENGKIVYRWKKNTSPLSVADYTRFVFSFKLAMSDAMDLKLKEWNSDRHIMAHRGSVSWNAHRKKYVMILVENFGTPGMLGEIWFTESDRMEGPYNYAQRIATHDRVNLYNPVHHSFLDKQDGRIIYFEGTYTNTFDTGPRVPYYNYNQLMYRLDLNDILIPKPFYFDGKEYSFKFKENSEIVWYAYEKSIKDVAEVPIYWTTEGFSTESNQSTPVFYACTQYGKNMVYIKRDSPNSYVSGSELGGDFIVFNKSTR
jgi:hypothetical protein